MAVNELRHDITILGLKNRIYKYVETCKDIKLYCSGENRNNYLWFRFGKVCELIGLLYADRHDGYNIHWRKEQELIRLAKEVIFEDGNIKEFKKALFADDLIPSTK